MAKRRTVASDGDASPYLPWIVPLLTAIVFARSLSNGFVWDDEVLLVRNLHFRGLGLSQLAWMFSAPRFGQYHPLAWMSFALDYLLFDMNAAGYHAVNVALHSINAALFFWLALELLRRCLKEVPEESLRWSAAFAALFFALHPLRTETVGWITERRGLLSALFLLATVYAHIKEQRAAALTFYALSLLSKASGVVLPGILLLLDYYPLRRSGRIWIDKLYYLILAIPFALIAPLAQAKEGAMQPFSAYGIAPRIGQASFGAIYYLEKTLVPVRLNPFVRFPDSAHFLSEPRVLLSLGLCAVITAAAALNYRRWPAAAVLWISYLLWLAPVSGLFQSGPHFAADRYSYLACLGWAILAGAGFARGLARGSGPALAAGIGLLAILSVLSWRQIGVWRDSSTLWSHVLELDPNSYLAHNNLCVDLRDAGRRDAAYEHCRAALALRPDYAQARCNLGNLLLDDGKNEEALAQFVLAARIAPDDAIAHFDLGVALERLGRTGEAAKAYQAAVELNPDYAAARNNLGAVLAAQTNSEEALRQFEKAIAADPGDPKAHFNLGNAYYQRQQYGQAAAEFEKALKRDPNDARAHLNLGVCLNALGKRVDAVGHFRSAIKLKPDFAEAFNNLGIVLFEQRRFADAVASFERAVALNPGYADARFNLDRASKLMKSMSSRPTAR